jgi:hypothetical protein
LGGGWIFFWPVSALSFVAAGAGGGLARGLLVGWSACGGVLFSVGLVFASWDLRADTNPKSIAAASPPAKKRLARGLSFLGLFIVIKRLIPFVNRGVHESCSAPQVLRPVAAIFGAHVGFIFLEAGFRRSTDFVKA